MPDPNVITHPDLTMPGVFDGAADQLPLRHRPTVCSHDNVWRTACDTIAFDFAARRYVLLNCAPCPACAAADPEYPRAPDSRTGAVRVACPAALPTPPGCGLQERGGVT